MSREQKMIELLKVDSIKEQYDLDKKHLAKGREDQNLKILSKYFPVMEKDTVLK